MKQRNNRSRKSDSYPHTYLGLAQNFDEGAAREKVLELPTQQAQLATRLDMYAYLRALRREGLDATFPVFTRIRIFASKEAPWTLTLKHPDDVYTFKVVK